MPSFDDSAENCEFHLYSTDRGFKYTVSGHIIRTDYMKER